MKYPNATRLAVFWLPLHFVERAGGEALVQDGDRLDFDQQFGRGEG